VVEGMPEVGGTVQFEVIYQTYTLSS